MSPAARRALAVQLGAVPRHRPVDPDGPTVAGRLPARRPHHPAAAGRFTQH